MVSNRILAMCAVALMLGASILRAGDLPASFIKSVKHDADKVHTDEKDSWTKNAWDDEDESGKWDFDEPWGNGPPAGSTWKNQQSADDKSCWIAVAANLLCGRGYSSKTAAQTYLDIIAVNYHISWQEPGVPHEAIEAYFNRMDNPPGKVMRIYGDCSDSAPDLDYANVVSTKIPANAYQIARQAIYECKQVGLGIEGQSIIGGAQHAVTLVGWDDATSEVIIADSDCDIDSDGVVGDFNRCYADVTPDHKWRIFYNNANCDVKYMVIIPEPGTLSLLALGAVVLLRSRRRARRLVGEDIQAAMPTPPRLMRSGLR